VLWGVGLVVAGLTAFYMFRQVFMVFFGECRADHETQHHLHESPISMTGPLWVLMAGSVLAGFLWVPHLAQPFEHWLEPLMGHPAAAGAVEHAAGPGAGVEIGLMALSVLVALSGIGLAYLMYHRRSLRPEVFSEALGGLPYRIVYDKYYVDEVYLFVFVRGGLAFFNLVAWLDLHVIDGLVDLSATITRGVAWLSGRADLWVVDGAVDGVAGVTQFVGRRVRNLQTGAISGYLYVIVIGVVGGVLLYWSWARAS
jgi:NADH-quinone oxidoreductase subunit L